MKCFRCGQEMVNTSGGNHQYPSLVNDLVYREATTITMPFNPDDYQVAIHCVICGKEVFRTKYIPVSTSELIHVCDDCKKAIAWVKEHMKEEVDERL